MSDDKTIAITIDGRKIDSKPGVSIWEVAQSMGVDIPRGSATSPAWSPWGYAACAP